MAFFGAKELRTGFDYRDVWREEHATSFTVAKAMELDVLSDIRNAVSQAMASGQTFREFSANLEPLLRAKGWWGRIDVPDPRTGEMVSAQLGSTRRLRTIYDANLRTAAAAGQWERIQESRESHPYLLYQIGPSREHRPEHVSWHGLMLPVDDPFWNSHFPPSGWGCKCHVRSVSDHEAERLRRAGIPDMANAVPELDPETGLPTGRLRTENMPVRTTAPETRYIEWQNTRTGRTELVPEGVDPGWDTNPGAAARRLRSLEYLTQRLETAAPADAHAILHDIARSGFMSSFLANPEGNIPVMRLSDEAAESIGASSRTVVLSGDSARKNLLHHPDLEAGDYEVLPGMGEKPDMILKDGDSKVVIVKQEGRIYTAAIKSAEKGLYLLSFRKTNPKDVRKMIRKWPVIFGGLED